MCQESARYAALKRHPTFIMNLGDAKHFVLLLLLSDCIPLSRKAMYWEWSDNMQNIIGRSTMSRNKFDSMMQNFYLENNDRFDVTKNLQR